jgi:hypothetical protein
MYQGHAARARAAASGGSHASSTAAPPPMQHQHVPSAPTYAPGHAYTAPPGGPPQPPPHTYAWQHHHRTYAYPQAPQQPAERHPVPYGGESHPAPYGPSARQAYHMPPNLAPLQPPAAAHAYAPAPAQPLSPPSFPTYNLLAPSEEVSSADLSTMHRTAGDLSTMHCTMNDSTFGVDHGQPPSPQGGAMPAPVTHAPHSTATHQPSRHRAPPRQLDALSLDVSCLQPGVDAKRADHVFRAAQLALAKSAETRCLAAGALCLHAHHACHRRTMLRTSGHTPQAHHAAHLGVLRVEHCLCSCGCTAQLRVSHGCWKMQRAPASHQRTVHLQKQRLRCRCCRGGS